jgi:peptidoglycan/xylan/chitin deacetylase (PgdA/CDA1 family)
MTTSFRRLAFQAMESPWFVRALGASRGPACATILMHRFSTESGVHGRHDPEGLRELLKALRTAGIEFVDLDQAIRYCDERPSGLPRLAVSFTVDDGYCDFADVAWPVFRDFDCPVSLFVVPGAIAGEDWFWWDKLEWIMRHSATNSYSLAIGHDRVSATWSDSNSMSVAFSQLANALKSVSQSELNRVILDFSEHSGLSLPTSAPCEYQVLGWQRLRELEKQGVRLGPHTMTHPVLSRCTDEHAQREIGESVSALRREVSAPLNVFCYPNGRPSDQGVRERQLVKAAGVPYALTTSNGLLHSDLRFELGADWQLNLPRVGYQNQAGRIIREFVS